MLQPPEEAKEDSGGESDRVRLQPRAQEPSPAEGRRWEGSPDDDAARSGIMNESRWLGLQQIEGHRAQPMSESQVQQSMQFPKAIAQEMLVKRETAHVSFFDQDKELSTKARIVF